MGKVEEEQSLSSTVVTEISEENVENRCRIYNLVRLRCVVVLLLSAAVFLSAIFWLPPFLRYGDRGDLDLDAQLKAYDIVASFKVRRPVSLLKANTLQLEYDIFGEIGVANSTVVVISLEPSAESNTTNVVFAIVPEGKYSRISSAGLSLLRSSFVYLVIRQSPLRLTLSLFGDAFSFEVLKFPEGITVIPEQKAFLLQKVQTLFNFTLNFPIYQILKNFIELENQLKSGLYLTPYENLYVRLTNSQGSTVTPPTTVQASVLLAIGNLPPSLPRLKQLAQTITGSPARNLGLNNTEFGRVKQVRLSSVLKHSLHSGGNSDMPGSPSPAPLSHHHYRHHHNHHHHHPLHRHNDVHAAPAIAPAPAPEKSYKAKAPSGCQFGSTRGYTRKAKRQPHLVPAVAPMISPHHSAASPHLHVVPPAPALHLLPAAPLPTVIFAHSQPPTKSKADAERPDVTPSDSPLPSSFSAGIVRPVQLAFSLFVPLVLQWL